MIPIYCVSFKNPERKQKLEARFKAAGLSCTFLENPVTADDAREQIQQASLATRREPSPVSLEPRTASIMLNHLQLIRKFYTESTASHAIFCEDDVHIRKSFLADLPEIQASFDLLKLDVLLLGYLLPFQLRHPNHAMMHPKYTYHKYGDDQWGAQMYMLSRKHAGELLQHYTLENAMTRPEEPFAADWTLTKRGRRAMIYPMLAVEEGQVNTSHEGQRSYHVACHRAQYDATEYN